MLPCRSIAGMAGLFTKGDTVSETPAKKIVPSKRCLITLREAKNIIAEYFNINSGDVVNYNREVISIVMGGSPTEAENDTFLFEFDE